MYNRPIFFVPGIAPGFCNISNGSGMPEGIRRKLDEPSPRQPVFLQVLALYLTPIKMPTHLLKNYSPPYKSFSDNLSAILCSFSSSGPSIIIRTKDSVPEGLTRILPFSPNSFSAFSKASLNSGFSTADALS